ncbi:hypothetical protein [Bradyrhizobium sp. 139]|uniref:hypothetical protein n=1 Tax=Bradyrhizobium sp. 139 TaxID=2782616 RepID=UPI001FF7D569|nr:hypothetical protein [Bradyrhizobium sp. 139]
MAKGNTPEGKVKAAVNKVLGDYLASYRYMPVPYGYGQSSLDYLICHYGLFVAIEAKAPGQKPTRRQQQIIRQIETAGGVVFVIDSVDGCGELVAFLEQVKSDASSGQHQTQDGGGAVRGQRLQSFPRGPANRVRRRAAPVAAASADRDLPAAPARLRGTGTDPDAL